MESPLPFQHHHDVAAKGFVDGPERMMAAAQHHHDVASKGFVDGPERMMAAAKENAATPRKEIYFAPQVPLMYRYYGTFTRPEELAIGSLWSMVRDLKNLDATWRGSLATRPTANEQRLYVLILAHVCSDIFLSHHENNLRPSRPPEEDVEWIVKEVRERASNFGAILSEDNLNIGGEDEDGNICLKNTRQKFFSSWLNLYLFIQNLFHMRDSICALPQGHIGDVSEVSRSSEIGTDLGEADAKKVKEIAHSAERETDGGQSTETGLYYDEADAKKSTCLEDLLERKTREYTLMSILWGLTCRRRERFYAPPVREELICYREIRKWVSSTMFLIKAKTAWLWIWGEWWGEAECGNNFAEERRVMRNDWEFVNEAVSSMEPLFCVPKGHGISAVFEELSNFRSPLSDWKKRFSNIRTARFYGDKSSNLFMANGVIDVGGGGRKRAQLLEECVAKKKNKYTIDVVDVTRVLAHSCKPTAENHNKPRDASDRTAQSGTPARGNDKSMKNRSAYLREILAYFRLWYPYCSLTARESRLYNRVLQHVRSSMWLFLSRETPEEMSGRSDADPRFRGNQYCDSSIPVSETWSSEQKPREHYLQEIVHLVEEIESLFWLSHMSLEEYLLYDKILRNIHKDLTQSSNFPKHESDGSTGTGHPEFSDKVALARRVLKTTCELEVQLTSSLEKDIGDTLGMIFSKGPSKESKVTEWLKDHMEEAVCDLKELATEGPRGFELFGRILLSMVEIEMPFRKLLWEFENANYYAYKAIDAENEYQVALMEGWSALRVLESG